MHGLRKLAERIEIMFKDPKCYVEYVPGKSFKEAFANDRIPLLSMHRLRGMDYRITRKISYERTVNDFLLVLNVNDSMRSLRNRQDMVVLLNEQGALIREDGQWTLYFTPDEFERSTLSDEDSLIPVLAILEEKWAAGKLARCRIPNRSLKTLVANTAPFSILDEYCKSQPGQYLAVAKQIVTDGPDELLHRVPVCRYKNLTTVDVREIENYNTVKMLLDDYAEQCEAADLGECIQPLSIAVFGYPGSGKSFGVKQIAETSGNFAVYAINLSQIEKPAALFEALDEALSNAEGSIPLVFFDEFDSDREGINRGWLRYFLAPMQDGEYSLWGKTKKINKAVFVFAGGTAHSFNDFLPGDDEERIAEFQRVKGPDFVSRLKGILNIRGLNPDCKTDRSHIIRRAMLLRQQIIRRIPSVYDEETGKVNISNGLLSALLRVSEYRHGARSLEFILAMCRLSHVSRFTPSNLPMNTQLDIHLNVADFERKLTFEQILGSMVEKYAFISHEEYRKRRLREVSMKLANESDNLNPKALDRIWEEEEMADWEDLDEFFKEGYRSRIRFLGEHLVQFDAVLGIRPIVPNAVDTIRELYGPDLELLSEIEHRRWVKDKLEDGWTAGVKDSELKHSPELVPYDELPESTKAFIRKEIREVPKLLKSVGYELYRKSY